MLFQAYRSKASHFSTTPSVGVPWISFPTMKKSEGRLLIQRLGIFFWGKLLVQTLRTFFCWVFGSLETFQKLFANTLKTPDVTGFSGKSLGFWAVSKAGTMASVRTSVKQSQKVWIAQGNASLFSKGCVFQGKRWIVLGARQRCAVVKDGKQNTKEWKFVVKAASADFVAQGEWETGMKSERACIA